MHSIGVRAPLHENFSLFSFPSTSLSLSIFPTTPLPPLVFSNNLDFRGSSDLFSSRSSVFRDPRLFSLSDSGFTFLGNQNGFDRHLVSPENSLVSRGQDTATMFSAFSTSSMVCPLVLLGLSPTLPKASGSPVLQRFPVFFPIWH